jgi:hypothetical protein
VKKILSIVIVLVLFVTLVSPAFAAGKAATAANAEKRKATIDVGRTAPEGWKAGDDVKITNVYVNGKAGSYIIPDVLDIRSVTLPDKMNLVGENDYYDLEVWNNLTTLMYTVYEETKIGIAGYYDQYTLRLVNTKEGFVFSTASLGKRMYFNDGWEGENYWGKRTFGKDAHVIYHEKGYYTFDVELINTINDGNVKPGRTQKEAWQGAIPIILRVVERPETAAK